MYLTYFIYSATEPELHVAEVKVVPKWKRELMDRKKGGQREHSTQPSEPKPSPASKVDANGKPPWMRELHEKKKKGTSTTVKVCVTDRTTCQGGWYKADGIISF